MGDRWNAGQADSTYVWLPLIIGEGGRIEMRNPAAEDPTKWSNGWDESYWDTHGAGPDFWNVTQDNLPATVNSNDDFDSTLPTTVKVAVDGTTTDVAVTWDTSTLGTPGARTVVGTLAADADFTAGRSFRRTVEVVGQGLFNIAPTSTPSSSSRSNLVASTVDGDLKGKGWDDWVSNGQYPKRSTLTYTWGSPRTIDAVQVHTYKDGAGSTWPSRIGVEYKNLATNAWVDSGKFATLVQGGATAPTARVELPDLPATSAVRLVLTTETSTWQSISEVEIFGYGNDSRTALTGLFVDGQPINGFDPSTWTYEVPGTDGSTPRVTVTAAQGADVDIVGPTPGSPFATITVTAPGTDGASAVGTYIVRFLTTATCGPVVAPWLAVPGGSGTTSFCQGTGGHFEISDNNSGAWTSTDALSVVHRDQHVAVGDHITTTVSAMTPGGNPDPRAGLVLRNDLSAAGRNAAGGYAVLATGSSGVFLQWDADGNGFVDSEGSATPVSRPVQLKLEYTSSDTATGFWRSNASDAWQEVGTAPLRGAATILDAGIFVAGNNLRGAATGTFDATGFSNTGPSPSPSASPSAAPSPSPSVTPSDSPSVTPSVSQTPTQEPTRTPTQTPKPTTSGSPSVTVRPGVTPTAPVTVAPSVPTGDIYTTPGHHYVNGRHWFTVCEPYSQTVRCRTDIMSTQVT